MRSDFSLSFGRTFVHMWISLWITVLWQAENLMWIIIIEVFYTIDRRCNVTSKLLKLKVQSVETNNPYSEIRLSTTAARIYFAFRGRLESLLVLTHCGVSPRPFLPQESAYIRAANKCVHYLKKVSDN